MPLRHDLPGLRLDVLLATSTWAEVWAGRADRARTRVAVKRLHPAPGAPSPADRAGAEVAVAAALDHPALSPVPEVLADGAGAALVRPLLGGGSLADLLAERGAVPVGAVAALLVPLAEVLDGLADRGVVHGDVTPGNVVLTAAGRPVLIDGRGAVAGWGTPAHLAPEVACGAAPSGAADRFGLAAIAYQLLGGRPPHGGDAGAALAAARAGVHRPLTANPGVARRAAEAVERGLDRDPARRPARAHELVEALLGAAEPGSVRLPGVAATAAARAAAVAPDARRTIAIAAPLSG